MALDPITNRIDQMTGATDAPADAPAMPAAPDVSTPSPVTDAPTGAAAPLTDLVPQEEFPQYEDQAGLRSLLIKAVKQAPKRTERPIIPPSQATGKVGPFNVIREDAPKANQILQDAPAASPNGRPSPTQPQIAAGVETAPFNLDNIADTDGVRQFINATASAYDVDNIERISYKDIAEKMSQEGYDEAFLSRILDPQEKTQADPKEAFKMLLAIADAGRRAYELGEKVKAAKAAGTLDADLASQFTQAIALEGALMKAAKGRQADIARTLGIFSQARRSSAQRGQMLDALLTEAGGIESVHDIANRYTALDSRAARANFAESGYTNDIKGWAKRFYDIGFGTWVNGLLSSPVTHAKNIAGNTFFGLYQMPERAVASVIGKGRNLLFGGEEAIALDEVYAQAIGMLQGFREGAEIAGKAFVKNEGTDAFAKIQNYRYGDNAFDVDPGTNPFSQAFSKGMRLYGTFVTLPGRSLMAEDEFFKAFGYRMELNALVVRESRREYRRLLEAGVPEPQAAQQAEALSVNLLTNPPTELDEAAKMSARTVTFTRELEPSLAKMQDSLNNPLLKIFFPFVRTPTNIAMEAMTRTPGLNLASPRFWGDFNAGGIRRDMALAKVTLGGGILYAAAGSALEGRMTGYGPLRTEDKKVLEGTGWQPFSFVLNKGELSYDMIEKFRSITSVSEGPDKIYVSYAGMEPLASLLAIASTAGEYSLLTADGADMEKLFMGGAVGLYEYMGDQPMLKGFGDLMKVIHSNSKDASTFLYNVMAQTSKQLTGFAIGATPAGAHSSLVAAVERVMHPERSQVLEAVSEDEVGVVAGARKGFWEAVGTAQSRNPLTSDKLPPMLDPITGEVKRLENANWFDLGNPFKTSNGKYAPAYQALLEYGVPLPKIPKKIDGVELSAEQYNRMIELATRDGQLEKEIVKVAESPVFIREAARDLGAAQEVLIKVMSDAYKSARERLIEEDADLRDQIESIKQREKDSGKYRR